MMKVCEILLCVTSNTINNIFINDNMDELQKKTHWELGERSPCWNALRTRTGPTGRQQKQTHHGGFPKPEEAFLSDRGDRFLCEAQSSQ